MRTREQTKRPRSASERCLLGLLYALILLLIPCSASAVTVPSAPTRWLTDNANFVSRETAQALDRKLEAYERQTGHQVVVWVGDTVGDAPFDEFMVKAFEAWRPGRKGKDDGILMVVLARDRKIGIEVGYGLEDRVPDAIASRIISDVMTPRLRAGDPDGALTAGVDALLQAIEGKPFATPKQGVPASKKPELSTPKLIGLGLMAIVFLVLFLTNPALALNLLVVLGSGRGGGFGGGGGGGFGGGGFGGGGGRSGGGGARGSW